MKGLVITTENKMQVREFGEPCPVLFQKLIILRHFFHNLFQYN